MNPYGACNKFLKYNPNIIEVTRENVKNILYDNIVAFTFAYPGAQGDAGELTVLHKTKDLEFYHTNRYYNDDEDLVKIIDNTYFKPFAEDIENNNGFIKEIFGWKKVYLIGSGNCAFVREEFYDEFNAFYNAIDKPYLNDLRTYGNLYGLLKIFFDDKFKEIKKSILDNKFII